MRRSSYNYSSPSGNHHGSYSHNSYSTPSGSRSYTSSSTYDSTNRSYGGGLTPSYGGYGSLSNLSSSRYSGNSYSSPYSSMSSSYSSPYSSSSYTSKRYSGDFSSGYTPYSSSYTPSSSSYSRSKYLSDSTSDYTPRSSYKPSSSYDSSSYTKKSNYSSKYDDSDSSYKPRKTKKVDDDDDYSSKSTKSSKKSIKFEDEEEVKPRRSRKTVTEDDDDSSKSTRSSRRATEKKSDDTSETTETRSTRRTKDESKEEETTTTVTEDAEGGADVTTVTKQTENLSLESKRPYEPQQKYQPPPAAAAPQQQQRQQTPSSAQNYRPQTTTNPAYPAESARYQEHQGDTPSYRGYTNPSIQSNSFKTLQNVIDAGQDPGSYFQKAPWQSQPVNQVSNEPRKYTPSQTWNAVHSDARNTSPTPGAYAPSKASSYKPSASPSQQPSANRGQAAPTGPPPPSMRGYGQQMHAADKYNYMFDTRTPSPSSTKPSGSPARNTTTELPHGDGVATKGKSAMNQAAAGSDKTPVCAKCESDIRGPFVLALNKSWCPHHFTCAKCESELVNMGFVELNGQIYCENDYETYLAPKCAKCRKAIVGDTVNALEKTWHPACFVCQECGSPISSGAFHVEEGLPYCMNDWQKLFQTKCTGCGYPVEPGDRWIEALDANWHSECFVCGKCRTKLEGKPFYPRDGKPYCKDHAQA